MTLPQVRHALPTFSLLLICAACTSTPTVDDSSLAETNEGAQSAFESSGEYVVTFRDRSIDLEPYVQGFPYSAFRPDLEHRFMLYFEDTPEGKWLRHLSWEDGEEIDVTAGRVLNDIDWSTRSFWGGEYNPFLEAYVFRGDERNDEIINLYALDLDDGTVTALTDVHYIYGVGYTDDYQTMAYVVRNGISEPFDSCLHVRDLSTDEDRVIWCDEGGADTLTWTSVEFSPDESSVILRIQHDGDRRRTNLALFDLDEPGPPTFLLTPGVEHLRLGALSDSFTDDGVVYLSANTGRDNLYRYDFATSQSVQLTDLDHDIGGAILIEDDQRPLLLLLQSLPYGTIVEFRDPANGEVLWSETRPESIGVRDDHGSQVLFSMSSVETPFRMERVEISAVENSVELQRELFAELPRELAELLIQCDVERVEFETFDDVDGQPRMLHAYLYLPKDLPPREQQLARMTAFYGGGNHFNSGHQIMCQAGIITFSPAPRGSRGFGADFAALTNGDLGGDEIVDLFFGARWLEANLGLEPRQIGVYGSSHGGYAAMRAMTFPPETNGHNLSYDFGFGMSHAGFSDIIHFFHNSNIPDWVILEAGNPATEADKLRDRSPLTHVERLQAPLLLTHGTNDRRVPVEGSRHFADAARQADAPVHYEEFEGQGHGIDGLDNRMRYYRVLFDFLENQVDPRLAN